MQEMSRLNRQLTRSLPGTAESLEKAKEEQPLPIF